MRSKWKSLFALAGLFLTMLPSGLMASSWVSDFTSGQSLEASPSWLVQLPKDEQKTFAELRYEITPSATASDLLITLAFKERPGGFLKVFWTTVNGSQMLSDNLYEGINMPNQRSLLISQLVLKEKGTLTFQSSQQAIEIDRIHWEWLEPKVVSAAGNAFTIAVLNANGKALSSEEISGDPAALLADQWKGSFITAPLSDKAERIEEGIEFETEFETAPRQARLEAWFSGLPLDKNLTVWVNGKALIASVEIPDLSDPGYLNQPSGILSYSGWRKAQLWLPEASLQAGVNKIQFSWGTEAGELYPVALKNLNLQLSFPATALPLPSPSPVEIPPLPSSPEPILDPLPLP